MPTRVETAVVPHRRCAGDQTGRPGRARGRRQQIAAHRFGAPV